MGWVSDFLFLHVNFYNFYFIFFFEAEALFRVLQKVDSLLWTYKIENNHLLQSYIRKKVENCVNTEILHGIISKK